MKKFLIFVGCVYAASLSMVACSEKTAPPVISFGGDTAAVVNVGGSYELKVYVNAGAKLKEVKYFTRLANGEVVPYGDPTSKFANAKIYDCSITLRDVRSNLTLLVQAVDRKGRQTEASFALTVSRPVASTGTKVAVTLGFNMLQSVGSSYSVGRSAAMLLADAKNAQQSVDFMVFNGKDNGVTVASPSNDVVTRVFNNKSTGTQTWGARNKTRLVKVNLDINAASLDDIAAALSNSSSTMANHLQEGDVVAFQTASGQMGLLQLSNVSGSASGTVNVLVRTI